MEHLFSPWRMEYILGEKQEGCLFCSMLARGDDRASLIVHRGASAFIVLNLYPYNNGHLLVVPYRHVDSLEALTDDEAVEVIGLVRLGMAALRSIMHPEGYNIGANVGRVAGAGVVDHVHLHVVPRWNGDTNFMSVFAGTRVLPQALEDTYDQLKTALAALLHGGQ